MPLQAIQERYFIDILHDKLPILLEIRVKLTIC